MRVAASPALIGYERSLWNGIFPEWSGNIMMGAPAASAGGGLTYPGTHLAYAIARHLLRNEFAQIDVSAILHILAGYFALYLVLRGLGVGQAISSAASVSLFLSGSILIMGRSWGMFIYGTFWAIILMHSMIRLGRGPVGWKWFVLTGVTIGIVFHIGFVQVWVTLLFLMGLISLYLYFSGQMPFTPLLWLTAAVVLGTAIAAPLMYQQWLLSQDLVTQGRSDNGIFIGWKSIFLPYPLAVAPHPNDWGGLLSRYMGQMYYFGTVFAVLPLLGLLAVLTGKSGRAIWAANLWTVMALIVFVIALGNDGGVWWLMSKLPVLNVVNHYPFRLLPFFTLFAVMGGALVAERLVRGTHGRQHWDLAIGLLTALFMAWHVYFARSSFYQYGFSPAQPLDKAIANVLRPDDAHWQARFMPWSPLRSCLPEFRDTEALDFPVQDGLLSFFGYDPLMESKPNWLRAKTLMTEDPLCASLIYGVRWHLISRLAFNPVLSGDSLLEKAMESSVPMGAGLAKITESHPRRVISTDKQALMDVGQVAPMAFVQGHAEQPLAVTISYAGVDVDTSPLNGDATLVLNWFWFPQMTAELDGKPLRVSADDWGRILVDAPTLGGILHVRYTPDWGVGMEIGAGLAIMALLMVLMLKRYELVPGRTS